MLWKASDYILHLAEGSADKAFYFMHITFILNTADSFLKRSLSPSGGRGIDHNLLPS